MVVGVKCGSYSGSNTTSSYITTTPVFYAQPDICYVGNGDLCIESDLLNDSSEVENCGLWNRGWWENDWRWVNLYKEPEGSKVMCVGGVINDCNIRWTVEDESDLYSTQYIVRTVEVTAPPPFRDWTPIGNLLMRALEDWRKKIGATQWNYEVMWG